MFSEQKIRALLFYFNVLFFLLTIPFLVSFALGYKFDFHTLRFTKTGLISIKTQPANADIYLAGRLWKEKSPTTITELLPGRYNVKIELTGYYPWEGEVIVYAGQVSRLEKITLFPLRPMVKQLNKARISSFWTDFVNGKVYYIDGQENIIYVSDLEGKHFTSVANLPPNSRQFKGWKLSPDRSKLLCFNLHKVVITPLASGKENALILEFPDSRILDIFWHSDSYHFILITDRRIDVCEAKDKFVPVALVTLNKKNAQAYYESDTLYFLDSQLGADGKVYDNVYRLDLGTKTHYLQGLIKSPFAHEE
ncbi:MAG: PEGA domain-containing protein [Candidatus Omnitrophica bacterium]|nr:PEGA domain-containing protein [Candidatus Omnitrophota bacterium]